MGITLRSSRTSVTGKRFGTPSAASSPASRLFRAPSKLLSLNSVFLFLACVAAAVIARDLVHIFARDSAPPSDPVPIDNDKGQLPPRNPVAVEGAHPSRHHVQNLIDQGVRFGDAGGLEVGAQGFNARYKEGQAKPVDLPPPGAPVAIGLWVDGQRVKDVPVDEKTNRSLGGKEPESVPAEKDTGDDEVDSNILVKDITGLRREGGPAHDDGKDEQVSEIGVDVDEDRADDGAEAALAGGMGAPDDGVSLGAEGGTKADTEKAVTREQSGEGHVGVVGLEHDLLNGLPDDAVRDGSTKGIAREEPGPEGHAADAAAGADSEQNLSGFDDNSDSKDQRGEENDGEEEAVHAAVGGATGDENDGRDEGEEGDKEGDENVGVGMERDDDGDAGDDGDQEESLEWEVPVQPVKDPNFEITMNNLEEVFGIKPCNKTVISKDMEKLLSFHDIREDEEYKELESYENMEEYVAKYAPLVHRGSGSILGGDQAGVFTDNIYVVRHSGDDKKGYGVYATAKIPPATILAEYGGELADLDYIESGQYAWETPELSFRNPINGSITNVSLVIDGKKIGNLMRFINDLGDKYHNVEPFWVPVNDFWHLFYVTTKPIEVGEELSVSYGDAYWGDSPPEGHTKESPPNSDTAQTGQFGEDDKEADDTEADKFETDDNGVAEGEDGGDGQGLFPDFGQGSEDHTEFSQLDKEGESGNDASKVEIDVHEQNEREQPAGEDGNSGVQEDPEAAVAKDGMRKVVLLKHYLTPEDVAARKRLASRNIPTDPLPAPQQVMT